MKLIKFFALSAALAAGMVAANAQSADKCNDIFVGGGVGIISPMTPGFNSPSVYVNLEVGKYITPVWGVRAVIGGPFQTLDANEGNATDAGIGARGFKNKLFGELNFDAMFSITNAFAKDLAKLNVYLFAGPTVNFSSEGSRFSGVQNANVILVEESDKFKVRAGATVGLGVAYNLTNSFALGLEGRLGVTPSIFGDADPYRKAEGTTRIALNGVWTIGGANGKVARAAMAAAAAGYISKEAAQALADEAVEKNPKIVEKIVEKPVVKEVEKVVETVVPASCVYEVGGYADKKTGSVSRNQNLAEKRAQAVYDALVEFGVDPSQLEMKAYGGVDPMFFNNDVLSRTVVIKKK